ncbi:serine protease [Candidatus Gracilibacteria bacterium]|nr:serine protease [Candidatus Gracilibacteria bacterium]
MKKLSFFLLCAGLFIPFIAQANSSPSLLQIVVFDWNEISEELEVRSFGSGTAIEKDLVLTNKHVVTHEDGSIADFLLLCPAQSKATHSVECNIPAAVVAVHPEFDTALVRPLSSRVFFPRVRTALQRSSVGDRIRIYGFPRPSEGMQNFGSTKTFENIKKWQEEGGPIEARGDTLTITRGTIQIVAQRKDTGEIYYLTDVKVNFGNSGGAAFDETGVFVGIPTLKDTDSNALVLAYPQLQNWILLHRSERPNVLAEVLRFYHQQTSKTTVQSQKEEHSIDSLSQGLRWRMLRRIPRRLDPENEKAQSSSFASIRTNYFRSKR